MVDTNPLVVLVTKEGTKVQVDQKFLNFSKTLFDVPNKTDEIPVGSIDEQTLKKIIDFYQLYKFNEDHEFEAEDFNRKISSDNLKHTLTEKNYKYIQDQGFLKNENEVDPFKMKDIIEACFVYDFKELRKTLLKAIGVNYWCETTEEKLEAFKKKHNLPKEIDPKEQLRIMTQDYKDVFDKLNQRLQEELKKANADSQSQNQN